MPAPIDRILTLVVDQNANELRLGTDEVPRMFQNGARKTLLLPATADDMLRYFLGSLLSPEREVTLRAGGQVDFAYEAEGLGPFQVTLTQRASGGGLDAVFLRGGRARAPRPPNEEEAIRPPPPAPATASAAAPPLAPPLARLPEGLLAEAAPVAVAPRPPPRAEAAAADTRSPLAGLLSGAVAARASDVHLQSGEVPSLRVDGRLRPLDESGPVSVEELLGPALTPSAQTSLAAGRSADLSLELPGLGRFRLNVYRGSRGLCAAIRVLRASAPLLSELNLPVPIDDLVELPHGLVIVCGPTGSGKSTTLAALAQEALRRRSIVLISLEDPIEYLLTPKGRGSLVRQRQIGREVESFPTGLRDALREDPDVLLIGEMRDPESITLALTAAETGHLVLTSLHSRSSASAIERIVDAYPPGRQQQVRVQLADALRAVVAERLLPRARGGGRVPSLEVLRGNHNVASIIRDGKTAQLATAMQSGRKEGMIPLERCLADQIRAGAVTAEEARAVANDTNALAGYLQA